MAGGTKRGGGGERVLESRHLVGLFLGVVLLCCVFFTLGYVMGRSQDVQIAQGPTGDSASAAVDAPVRPSPTAVPPASTAVKPADSGEWDFSGAKKSEEQGTAPDQAASGLPRASSSPAAAPAAATSSAVMPPATSASGPPPAQPVVSRSVPPATKSAADSSKALAQFHAPRIPHGAFVWQIAALTHESDALAMADALQQKRFPAFVLTPAADNFFRVQVGPYADAESAALAKHALEHEGFKPIVKR